MKKKNFFNKELFNSLLITINQYKQTNSNDNYNSKWIIIK